MPYTVDCKRLWKRSIKISAVQSFEHNTLEKSQGFGEKGGRGGGGRDAWSHDLNLNINEEKVERD